jgi:hypothetical protein
LTVAVAAFEHLIGPPGGDDLSLGSVFADQQIGGSPDVALRDHSHSPRSAEPQAAPLRLRPTKFLSLDDLDSAARRVLIVRRRYHNPANRGDGSASSLSVEVVLWGIAVRSLIGTAFAASTTADAPRLTQVVSGRAFVWRAVGGTFQK